MIAVLAFRRRIRLFSIFLQLLFLLALFLPRFFLFLLRSVLVATTSLRSGHELLVRSKRSVDDWIIEREVIYIVPATGHGDLAVFNGFARLWMVGVLVFISLFFLFFFFVGPW